MEATHRTDIQLEFAGENPAGQSDGCGAGGGRAIESKYLECLASG